MGSYTITITPDDEHATSTQLRLETSGDQVILTDLHLHASGGLSTGQLPAIDYGLLLRAITPAAPTPISASPAPIPAGEIESGTTPSARVRRPSPAKTHDDATKTNRTKSRTATTRSAPAEQAKPTRGRRSATTATKASTGPSTTDRRGRKTDTATATRKTKGNTATKTINSSDTGRAYRRTPDDLTAVYQQAGTAAAIADHYGVPTHTAHSWIRRLRKLGMIPASR